MTASSIFALVPARGGSKGVPRKNARTVAGVPLLGDAVRKTLRAAQLLGAQARVVCSTDDAELADVAREWSAEVPFLRPAPLATDAATSMDVVLHALETLSIPDDTLVLLVQPTSPLSTAEDIAAVVRLARETGAPALSVAASAHPRSWMWGQQPDGRLLLPTEDVGHQRQSSAATVTPTGAAYAATAGHLRKHRSFMGPDTRGAVMPASRALDVDHPDDLSTADAVLRARVATPMRLGNGRMVGPGHPCFVIAEAGVNHNGKVDLGLRLIDAALEAGADAVKFQTFKTDKAIRKGTPKAGYQVQQTGGGTMEDMVRALELSPRDHQRLWDHARERGITIFSSPFDPDSVSVLTALGVPVIKLASGEITNRFMLEAVAATGLPLIMSSGMANLPEIERALQVLAASHSGPVSLLHCVSSYPAPPSSLNLRAMETMQAAFGLPTGWSDHSMGPSASVAAVAMGACIVEKHITLDRTMEGPDHTASMEPADFKAMMATIRELEAMKGSPEKRLQPEETDVRKLARRSLVARTDLPAGTVLTRDHFETKRPGTGISSMDLPSVLGRRLTRALAADDLLTLGHLE